MTDQTPATEAGRRPEEVLGDEDTWAYHPPEPVISREDWDQAIDTTGMKRVGPDPQTPATEAGRPEPINDHERWCPSCRRVIRDEQNAYDEAVRALDPQP